MRLLRHFSLALWWLAASQSWALNTHVALDETEKVAYVTLWGQVEPGDDTKFRAAVLPLVRSGYLIFEVSVFSPGGETHAAIGIGRQIKTLQTRTGAPFRSTEVVCSFHKSEGGNVVSENASRTEWCTCASACFLIWAAGTIKEGDVLVFTDSVLYALQPNISRTKSTKDSTAVRKNITDRT